VAVDDLGDRVKHFRRVQVVALLAVLGPGLLAGLSDDDPAGITTYSLIGTEYGYQLLWVLATSTVALILFHDVTARMGIVTGRGLAGLIRERYGLRIGFGAVLLLLAANLGTTAAEFAGIAASMDIAGVTKYVSVPVAAILVSTLVLRGSFRRVQQILLVMGSLLGSYVISGILAGPDWSQALRGLVTPSVPLDRTAILLTTATIGTTLAPWGIAFLQSYVVDKRLAVADLRLERIDVVVGSILTGVIGFFVVVACAATLHVEGKTITSASDAAAALEPLAGHLASTLFAVGLLGAGLLAAAILPLSTAYSVSEAVGVPAALDRRFREASVFYGVYGFVVVAGAGMVLIPGAPLVPILYLTQALNAILLIPLLVLIIGLSTSRHVMGDHAIGRGHGLVLWLVTAVITLSVAALIWLTLF
jgi:NRAMP (natural resistance-associated macrophage protein)-like metal ion transporter